MIRHCENAERLAQFLQSHPRVSWVNHLGLRTSEFRERVTRLFAGRAGGLFTFGLGDKEKAFAFIDSLKLVKNLANLGDAKTLVVHPASTIFHEFDADKLGPMGVTADMVRVSVGIEDFEDIKADFEQAIARAFKETS
jgi:O-acetylhomoserine (thiol)-lyase